MSGTQVSSAPNVLFDPMMALRQQEGQNQLLEQQQDIGGYDIEMASRIAGTLMDKSLYPTPEARAAAYPTLVGFAQQQGYLKKAPSIYPGDDQTMALSRMGTPSADLYKLGLSQQAKTNLLPPDGTAPATVGGGGVAAPGPGGLPGQGGAIEPFATRLQGAEGNPGSVNAGGYSGQYQFGTSRLADLGMYKPAAGENIGANQWRGTLDIPGFPDVKTQADFLANPAAQRAALDVHVRNIDTAIAQTPGADKYDANGLRAVAHLGGPEGMRKFVASNGQYDPADANGTHLSDYYRRFSAPGGGGTAVATTARPSLIRGDSLASSGGLGGSGEIGARPGTVLATVTGEAKAGVYRGQPVVLSTGASNDPGDLASVEQQVQEARGGGASSVTVLGVGPGVEAKAPGTNAALQAIAQRNGAQFVPLPTGPGMISPDGVHPTAQGYATLKTAVAPPAAAPGAPVTPAPYRVAGAMQPPPGTAAAPGQAAPAPGQPAAPGGATPPAPGTVAQPQQPADLPPVPQPPPPLQVKSSGYTDAQERALRTAASDPTVSPDEFRKQQNSYLAINAAANEKNYADSVEYANAMRERAALLDRRAKNAAEEQRATETAKLAAEAAQRAVEAAQRAKEAHELTMRTQGLLPGQQRDEAGNVVDTPGAHQPPPPGYRYNAQGGQEIIPGGPADPAVVKAQADARLEPPPGYRRQQDGSLQIIPGGPADPDVLKAQSEAKGAGGRNMPPTERDKLIKTAGQIDEMGLLKNNFQDYGGFYTASIGDLVNYVARNTPNDSPRAEWWQEYQRQKLAARQAISGQSLTASELVQYERADINPGMSNDIIRKNLEIQQNILMRARDRTVLSMAKDGYNPGAIEEAAAVRLADAQSRMSKDVVEQGSNKPLANTKIRVDASGRIIP